MDTNDINFDADARGVRVLESVCFFEFDADYAMVSSCLLSHA